MIQKIQSTPNPSPLVALSKDVIINIFLFLPLSGIGLCARSCKKLYRISKEKPLWGLIFKREWPSANFQLERDHLDSFKSSFFEYVKKSKIFSDYLKLEKYTHHVYSGFLHTQDYLYNKEECIECHHEDKIIIVDTKLGSSYTIQNSDGMPLKIISTSANRIQTVHQNPKNPSASVYTLWNAETGKQMVRIEDITSSMLKIPFYINLGKKIFYVLFCIERGIKIFC